MRRLVPAAIAALLAAAGCKSTLEAAPMAIPPGARAGFEEATRRLERAHSVSGEERARELAAALAAVRDARSHAPEEFRLAVLEQDVEIALDPRAAHERYAGSPAVTAAEKTLAARILLPERVDDARDLLLAACEQDSRLAWARYGLAFVERERGESEEARKDAEKALELDPSLVEALRLLAELYDGAGDREKALLAREKLVEVTSGDLRERHRYARLLLEADDRSDATDAEKELRVILAALGDPPAPENRAFARDATLDLGTAYARRNQVEQAISHWRKALELDPECLTALYNIGIVELKQRQDPAAALAAFQAYLDRAKSLTAPLPADQIYYRIYYVPHQVQELQDFLKIPRERAPAE